MVVVPVLFIMFVSWQMLPVVFTLSHLAVPASFLSRFRFPFLVWMMMVVLHLGAFSEVVVDQEPSVSIFTGLRFYLGFIEGLASHITTSHTSFTDKLFK